MARGIQWVEDDRTLQAAMKGLGTGPLAVDTEADSLHHYPEKVCLIQLTSRGEDLLLDPLSSLDVSALGEPFRDPAIRKILHGADYDLRMLDRDFGIGIRGLFDTMLAARLIGERSFGLAALLEKFFGVRLDKRFQRADWSQRPLPDELRRYAVMDTRHLEELAQLLEERLVRMGRETWAAEEFAVAEKVRWIERGEDEAFRRVKGSARLDRRGLAVLRELHGWRDAEARRRDRPPFRVLGDTVLLSIARARPGSRRDLLSVEGLPESSRHGRRASGLLDAVARATALPESSLPERARGGQRPDAGFESRLRELMKKRDRLADELGIESSVLASRSVLTAVLGRIDNDLDPAGTQELKGWQLEVLKPVL